VLDGVTTYFRENGKKSSEVTMTKGNITASIGWDENGKLEEKSTGDGTGRVDRVYYYPNGNIKSFGTEVWNNKEKKYARVGNWKYNFENGVNEIVEIYKDGTLSKRWEQYLKSGEKILSDGNGEYRTFHKNGQVSYTAQIKNGVEDGIVTWYFDNGTKELVHIYKNGKVTKTWEQYLKSGEKILGNIELFIVTVSFHLQYKLEMAHVTELLHGITTTDKFNKVFCISMMKNLHLLENV
jgi:antitoxin component YwqK of YwqJK toxin-antitoxin module